MATVLPSSVAYGNMSFHHILDDVHVDVGMRLHLLALVQADCPDVVGTAAAAGDVEALTTYLQKYPHEVTIALSRPQALTGKAWG